MCLDCGSHRPTRHSAAYDYSEILMCVPSVFRSFQSQERTLEQHWNGWDHYCDTHIAANESPRVSFNGPTQQVTCILEKPLQSGSLWDISWYLALISCVCQSIAQVTREASIIPSLYGWDLKRWNRSKLWFQRGRERMGETCYYTTWIYMGSVRHHYVQSVSIFFNASCSFIFPIKFATICHSGWGILC